MAVTNSYNNAIKITKAALAVIEGDCTLLKHCRRDDKEFAQDGTAQAGDTRNIRIPGYGKWREGKVADPSALNDTYAAVTLKQGGADFILSSFEERLNVDELIPLMKQRIATVVNQLDTEAWAVAEQFALMTGTGGTRPTDMLPYMDAKAYMHLVGGVPKDDNIAAVSHELHIASLINGSKLVFNPGEEISKQYREGNIGRAAGMKWSSDRNATTHTFGTYSGTPLMNGTTLDGATSIVTNGWGSGVSGLNAGDVFTIDGVYAVNPVSKASLGILKQHCVKTTVTDTSGDMTIELVDALTLSGPNQNISALPVNDAAINVAALTGKVCRQSLVLHPDSIIFASAVLPMKETGQCSVQKAPDLNLSIRVWKYDNGMTDDSLWRLDVLRGFARGRKGFAARVIG